MSTLSRSSTGLGEKPPVVLSQVPLKLKKTEKIEFIQPCLKLMNVQNILTLFEPLNPTLQWLSIIGEVFNPNASQEESLVTKATNRNKVEQVHGLQHQQEVRRRQRHQQHQLQQRHLPPQLQLQRKLLGSDQKLHIHSSDYCGTIIVPNFCCNDELSSTMS